MRETYEDYEFQILLSKVTTLENEVISLDYEFQILLSKVTTLENEVLGLENEVKELNRIIHKIMNQNVDFKD